MQLQTVIYEKRETIAVIKLNRPQVLNAQNKKLVEDLSAALEAARADDQVRVVVLEGEGRAFCVGNDLKAGHEHETLKDVLSLGERLQETFRAIVKLGKPIIAAVHGYALGGGLEWALACDVRIAAEGTKFGFPEVGVGATVTYAGTKILPQLIGMGRAKELIFTTKTIDARQAEQWGMVNKVVAPEELDRAAMEMAENMTRHSELALKLSRIALDTSVGMGYEEQLNLELAHVVIAASSQEIRGREKAFMERERKK